MIRRARSVLVLQIQLRKPVLPIVDLGRIDPTQETSPRAVEHHEYRFYRSPPSNMSSIIQIIQITYITQIRNLSVLQEPDHAVETGHLSGVRMYCHSRRQYKDRLVFILMCKWWGYPLFNAVYVSFFRSFPTCRIRSIYIDTHWDCSWSEGEGGAACTPPPPPTTK